MDGCTFNRRSTIWRFSSSWTFVISSLALWAPVANLWLCAFTSMSARMASSKLLWQVSSIRCTSYWFFHTTSSCYKLSCSIFIFFSLRNCSVQLSLARTSTIIPSYKTYKVSHGSAAILLPRPFNVLTLGLSASFDVTSAPCRNTMVFFICTWNFFSATGESTTRLVERVPS